MGPRFSATGSLRPFFFQAEDGIRDKLVTGVQTCALPISDARPLFLRQFSQVSAGRDLASGHDRELLYLGRVAAPHRTRTLGAACPRGREHSREREPEPVPSVHGRLPFVSWNPDVAGAGWDGPGRGIVKRRGASLRAPSRAGPARSPRSLPRPRARAAPRRAMPTPRRRPPGASATRRPPRAGTGSRSPPSARRRFPPRATFPGTSLLRGGAPAGAARSP